MSESKKKKEGLIGKRLEEEGVVRTKKADDMRKIKTEVYWRCGKCGMGAKLGVPNCEMCGAKSQ